MRSFWKKKSLTPRQGKIQGKIRLANMVDVKIHLDLYVHISYINCEMFKNISFITTTE